MTNVIDHSPEIAAAIRKAFSEFPKAHSVNDKITPFTWLLNCLWIDGVVTAEDVLEAHHELDNGVEAEVECRGTVVYGAFPPPAEAAIEALGAGVADATGGVS